MAATSKSTDTGFQNYVNTLIFCIIAKLVTVVLLVLLLTSFGASWAYSILTIEVGLVVVIIMALLTIQQYERRKVANLNAARAAQANINVCPDWYVKSVQGSNGEVVCTNVYKTSDGRFTYTMGTAAADQLGTINLSQLAPKDTTMDKVCSTITDSQGVYSQHIAWTGLKPMCEL